MTDSEHELGRETLIAVEKAMRIAGDRLSATWDPQEWREDPRFIAAIDMLAMDHKRDALKALAQLYHDAPTHLFGRLQLFALGVELNEVEVISGHAEWALSFHAQHTGPEAAVDTYRSARLSLPTLEWSERALLTALHMGEKARDNRVVVDAGRVLLATFPESRALPRALLACADVQMREGRPDLADKTLKNLLVRYPLDPLVPHAERRLAEVERRLAELQELADRQQRERELLIDRQQRIERQMELQQRRMLREQEDLEGQEALEEYQRLEQEQFAEQMRAERQHVLEEYQRLEQQQLLENQRLAEQQRQHDLAEEEPHSLDELMQSQQVREAPRLIEQQTITAQPLIGARTTEPPQPTEQPPLQPHWTEPRPLAEELALLTGVQILTSGDATDAEARARRFHMFPATLRPMRVVCDENDAS